ncbi:MAG: DNA-directed RNA polymerase subunit omega [Candidatus Omnitrophica bacterium]|nr:DNA-directed RNA polymerase subunit omega [Candidatus Omnitrophota bacterium]
MLLGATGGSIYKLTILASKRAMMFAEGEKPLVERKTEKLLDIALEEIEKKKIKEFKGKNLPAGRQGKTKKDEEEPKEEKKKTAR